MASEPEGAIAIIGMAGRFPGAESVEELWQNLCQGKVSIRTFGREELRAAGVPDDLAVSPDYVPAGADVPGVDLFDARFFGIAPREAQLTDPQQRFFLECAWRALSDAGHDPLRFPGRVGVFGASGACSYLLRVVLPAEPLPPDGISYPILVGNDKDYMCARVSHRLGLTGPSMVVQTACSSSLVAVHLAVQSLLDGECELALAGGVSITVPSTAGYLHRDHGILSADGHCRVFDAQATGTVKGNGCGVVVLRRLQDALEAHDQIYAVIRGTAVNNDGMEKVSFLAPGVGGQVEVIRQALAVAEIPAAQIGYVEAHGTGTRLGDPIELQALSQAHGSDDEPLQRCWLGAVKANLGHLDAAAGVTGLIKTALVLRHQVVPVQPDFATPNPQLVGFLERYTIPGETIRPGEPLRAAATSSFGLGGTNAHAVLVPAPPPDGRPAPQGDYLIALSATDAQALAVLEADLREHLAQHPGIRIDDLAFTLARGRTRYAVRSGFLASSIEDFLAGTRRAGPALEKWLSGADVGLEEVGDLAYARRISLPAHPLRRIRCWLEPPAPDGSMGTGRPVKVPEVLATPDVLAVVRRCLGVPGLALDDDLLDLGADSIAMVELVAQLSERAGRSLRFEDFVGVRTAREIDRRLEQTDALAVDGYQHLLAKISEGGEGHVFLVHPAGGTTICYADLSRHVQNGRTMWGLAFPMSEGARFPTMRDLARLYIGLIRTVQPAGPYLLGGYSFGGNLAIEMALQLEAQGDKVEQVVVIDSHPPEAYLGGSAGRKDFISAFPALVAAILPGEFPPPAAPPGTLAEAIAAVRQPSWPSGMDKELAAFFDVWVHNHQALKRWYPDASLKADLVVLAATEPEDATILDQLQIRLCSKEAWAQHAEAPPRIVPVGGTHYSLMRDDTHLRALAAAYDNELERVKP